MTSTCAGRPVRQYLVQRNRLHLRSCFSLLFFFLSILSYVYSKIVQSPERSSTTNIKYLCYILNSIGQFCFADSKYIVCVNLWC